MFGQNYRHGLCYDVLKDRASKWKNSRKTKLVTMRKIMELLMAENNIRKIEIGKKKNKLRNLEDFFFFFKQALWGV